MLINDIIKEINDIIQFRKLNISDLAKELKVGRTTFYSYLTGKTDMPLSIFLDLCDKLHLDIKIEGTNHLDKAMIHFRKELKEYIDQVIKERI